MKNTILAAALSAVVLSSMPALAQPASGAQANLGPPNVQEFDKRMAQAQGNMKKMQEQMDKINQTQDPEARQKLLQEHWATMQNNMQLMHGMWGPGGGMGCCMGGPGMMGPGMTMGPMMGWGHMGGYYSKFTPEQQRQRQYMMDQYMPMQQMMMDHMMRHQQYMWMR